MLDWIERGVRDSLATYCGQRGVPVPRRVPYFGPRSEHLTPETIASLEVEPGMTLQGRDYTIDERWWTTGIGNQELGEPIDDFHMKDCVVRGGTKWASRSYRMRRGNALVHCAFTTTWPEHDAYWNMMGYDVGQEGYGRRPAFSILGCYFEDTGSQSVQIVQREIEWYGQVPAADLTPGGPIVVMDTLSRNAGLGIDHPAGIEGKGYEGDPRSAFAFSFFRSKHNVFMRRVMVDKTMQMRSSGCLLVEGRPRCVVDSCAFMSADTRQPLAIFRDIDDLVIRKSWWSARAGQAWISLERVKRVTIEGCQTGGALPVRVQIDGVMGSPINTPLIVRPPT
jgi:hypothetical protein